MTASTIPTPDGFARAASRVFLAAAPIVAVALASTAVTKGAIPDWYEPLLKPPGTPPNWVFAPAWTVLYAFLAVALWRLLALPVGRPGRRSALLAFAAQLLLNGLWSWSFFGMRDAATGLINIALLDLAIVWAVVAALRVDRVAALLLLPYAAWVAFATYLNAGVWWLNGGA